MLNKLISLSSCKRPVIDGNIIIFIEWKLIAPSTKIIIAPNPCISIRCIKAYLVLNILGDEACKLFQYLRNKYSRDKKKIAGKNLSGSSTDEVREAKVEASEMYSFLSWLDPYVHVHNM